MKKELCEFYPKPGEGSICDAGINVLASTFKPKDTLFLCTKEESLKCKEAVQRRKEVEAKKIAYQIKYLGDKASELSQKDLDWAIKMEDAYKRQGYLTIGQKETLDAIFKRY